MVVVNEHVVGFAAAVVQPIMSVVAQLELIVNDCAAAEEAVFEVLVVVAAGILLILHQEKMDPSVSCLRSFLCYDKRGI